MRFSERVLLSFIEALRNNPAYLLIFAIAALFSGTFLATTGYGIYQGDSTPVFLGFGGLVVTLIAAVVVIAIFHFRPPTRIDGPPPEDGQDSDQEPLRALLNFGSDDLYFVYPPRTERNPKEVILPRISAEDFYAINIILRLLRSLGWDHASHVRDTERFENIKVNMRSKNLVVICSQKTNTFTEEVMDKLHDEGICPFDFEELPGNSERWRIRRGARSHYESKSYSQQEAAIKDDLMVAAQRLDDVAVLAKFTNPWDPTHKNKILVVAGVRGIGTWGAAEFLRRYPDTLYDRKRGTGQFNKHGNFVAYLDVRYKNFNITDVRLRHLDNIT